MEDIQQYKFVAKSVIVSVSTRTSSEDNSSLAESVTLARLEKVEPDPKAAKHGPPRLVVQSPDSYIAAACPAKDTSHAAWKIMLAAILAEAPLLGFPLSYGMFQSHYDVKFPGNTSSPWIGVLVNGIYFLAAPLMTHICQKYAFPKQYLVLSGWAVCVLSFFSSAFCPVLSGLIVLQGVLYGIGLLLIEMPLLIILNTWFDKRRGLAYGLLFAASDLCGVIWAFLAEALFHRSGYRVTVLVMSALIFGICGPAIFLLHERPVCRRASIVSQCDLPFTPSGTEPSRTDPWAAQPRKYYKRSIFYIIALANIFQAFAFELPFIYLPSSALDLGYSSKQSTIVLGVGILGQVIGELAFGELSDRLPVTGLVIVTTLASSLATFLLWGLGRSLALLIVYAVVFGTFGSGFLALWARLGMLFGEKDAAMVYSTLCTGRGIGVIASGPISSIIVAHGVNIFAKFGPSRYGTLTVFVGSSMGVAAVLGMLGVGALPWNSTRREDLSKV